MYEKQIGQRIQTVRKQRGLTQEQLAEQLDISTTHMSATERGVSGITVEKLVQIMNCLDCTADDLFCDVIKTGYRNKASRLSDLIAELPAKEQKRIFDVVETMVRNAK